MNWASTSIIDVLCFLFLLFVNSHKLLCLEAIIVEMYFSDDE